jgi:hypothetical protein
MATTDTDEVDAVSAWSTAEHLRYWSEHGLLG